MPIATPDVYAEMLDRAKARAFAYDPRSYMEKGENSMAQRVAQACEQLGSAGQSIGRA